MNIFLIIKPEYDRLPQLCYESYTAGNCSQNIPAWAFDANSGRCINFFYTGCDGNDNKFVSEEQCQRTCGQFRGLGIILVI